MKNKLLALLALLPVLAGCNTIHKATAPDDAPAVKMDRPITIRPVVEGRGTPIAVQGEDGETRLLGYEATSDEFDGVRFTSDDIAMQMGMMAQGLPTESWFADLLPDLFTTDVEEVRAGIVMYGARLQMWAKTVVRIGSFTVGSTSITQTLLNGDEMVIETPTFETPEIRFPTSQPPAPPKFMSGLQRLGIGGAEILSGLVSYFAFDVAKESIAANREASATTADAAQAGFDSGADAATTGFEAGLGNVPAE